VRVQSSRRSNRVKRIATYEKKCVTKLGVFPPHFDGGQVREKAAQSPTCREMDHATIRSSWGTMEFRLRIIPLEPKRSPQRRDYSGRLGRDYCVWRTTFRPILAMLLPFVIDAPDLRGVSTLRPARCTARRTRNTRRLTPSTKAPGQLFSFVNLSMRFLFQKILLSRLRKRSERGRATMRCPPVKGRRRPIQ
jgi:hypothetical protein